MKNFFAVFIALIVTDLACAENHKVSDFALIDQRGGFHQLSHYANRDAVVIYTHAIGDDRVRAANTQLQAAQAAFSDHNVAVLMINAMPNDDRTRIQAAAESTGVEFPILIDEAQLVAESLSITRTGEVLVINPQNLTLVYRGPISAAVNGEEQNFLQDSLHSLIAGQTVNLNPPSVAGKAITFPLREKHLVNTPSYQNDIVPILQERCVACHQDGALAPWAPDRCPRR